MHPVMQQSEIHQIGQLYKVLQKKHSIPGLAVMTGQILWAGFAMWSTRYFGRKVVPYLHKTVCLSKIGI